MFRKWRSWIEQFPLGTDIVVARSILPKRPIEEYSNCEIVGFGDSSSNAFGGVVYLRWSNKDESNIEIKFLGAKGKVGPIGGNTIPRQELGGALVVARLTNSINIAFSCTELKNTITRIKLFTDSTTVLLWINSEAMKFRPYVKHKVIEIQDLVPVKVWSYIPTSENKAVDLISKGCDVKDLDIILKGPRVLWEKRATWDNFGVGSPSEVEGTDPEEIKCNVTGVEKEEVNVIQTSRYSSFKKIKRVTAYIFRR